MKYEPEKMDIVVVSYLPLKRPQQAQLLGPICADKNKASALISRSKEKITQKIFEKQRIVCSISKLKCYDLGGGRSAV